MRILVFSDSHKDTESMIKVINRIVDVDMIIHTGDHHSDAEQIEKLFPNIPVKYVLGNCDFGVCPTELVIDACGKKIFLTHGHFYSVKYDYDYHTIFERTKELGCDAVVFGHTHKSICDVKNGITLLNPGSVCYGKTFGVIEIENGKLKSAICSV